ncbi:MAG: hypothetical protein MZW92_31515 [Comamonadaceae bacterium]|nr:hypothetical protein [Comamonadaceae bacterium]
MYEPVRALTGNDDPTLGVELLPDARIAVLLKSAKVRTLQAYSESFPAVSLVDAGSGVVGVATTAAPTTALSTNVFNAITFAAAHKYFVSIGFRFGVNETLGLLAKTAELIAGIDNQPFVTEATLNNVS